MDNVLSSLEDTAEAALDLLNHAMLSVEGRRRLLDYVAANHQASGHIPTEELTAERLFDENKANAIAAVEAYLDAIAPSRTADALAPLQEFVRDAVGTLEGAEFDLLERKLTALSYTRNRLSQALPPPSAQDEARRTASVGWNSLEREFLASELSDEDLPLASCDARQAITQIGRVISRQELRKRNRPLSWTRIDTWQEQFPEILTDQE